MPPDIKSVSPARHARAPRRPVVLLTAGHYLPGFCGGGPIRSIARLVDHLSDEFDFRILTSDRDLGDDGPYKGIESDCWTPVGPALVHYTSPAKLGLGGIARIIRNVPHDLFYLNSFFSPRFTIFPLTARRLKLIPCRPTLLAPRGEFSAGALSLKPLKKRSYIAAGRMAGLFNGLRWQASSEFEGSEIRAIFGNAAKVTVACDLSAERGPVPPAHTPRAPEDPLRIVFISRLSPKKNLDYALRVLRQVRAPVVFTIYGPEQSQAYSALCRGLAAELPTSVRVVWSGSIAPERIVEAFAAHDLFFFPTRGENFGHVIDEALAAGTPVLLSDQTPWRGLAASGVGQDLPLENAAAFAAFIESMAAESAGEAMARRRRAAAFSLHDREGDIRANRRLFRLATFEGF